MGRKKASEKAEEFESFEDFNLEEEAEAEEELDFEQKVEKKFSELEYALEEVKKKSFRGITVLQKYLKDLVARQTQLQKNFELLYKEQRE